MPLRTEELGHDWILMYWFGRGRIRHRHSPDLTPVRHGACPNCGERLPEHIINTAKLLLIGEKEKLDI